MLLNTEHHSSRRWEASQRQTIKAWTTPSLPVTTVNAGRGCVGEGMSKRHILFIKQQSQDCWSLSTFGKAREVNKICDAFCCCKNAITVMVSCSTQSRKGNNGFLLSLVFLSLLSILSFLTRPTSFTSKGRKICRRTLCLVEILPLALPKLNNETEDYSWFYITLWDIKIKVRRNSGYLRNTQVERMVPYFLIWATFLQAPFQYGMGVGGEWPKYGSIQ